MSLNQNAITIARQLTKPQKRMLANFIDPHVRGAAHPGDICTEVPGKLHRGAAYTSGSAIDQYSLPALKFPSSQEIQRRRSAER
jgi:hypothetical protein